MPPPAQPTPLVAGNYPSENLTLAAGIAIFHLATARVVLCYHTRDAYHFLPKGRLNANEPATAAASREGFEESGYRNRVLPLPLAHRQPQSDEREAERFVAQPVWMQLMPLGGRVQYVLFWFVGETVCEEDEEEGLNGDGEGEGKPPYCAPPPFPAQFTLRQRMEADISIGADGVRTVYEPRRYEGTGVDAEERLYTSALVPIEEARRKLRGSVMEDVVRRGWEAVQLRMRMEAVEHTDP